MALRSFHGNARIEEPVNPVEASQLGHLFLAGVLWGQMTGYVVGREKELTRAKWLLWQGYSCPSHQLCQVGHLQVL